MATPVLTGLRRRLLSGVSGKILEIGIGTGLNLAHYPRDVRRIVSIDPSQGATRMLRKRIAQSAITVHHCVDRAESLPFQDNSFDCVVGTWTLCSIPDVNRAIADIHRVLRPGGRFHFIEHGLSDVPTVRTWQRRLNWLQLRLAGCRLDLNFCELFAQSPFESAQIDRFNLKRIPRTHAQMFEGVAVK